MLDRYPWLHMREDDSKRLNEEFNDRKIAFVRNIKTHSLQVWYMPNSGSPYKITDANDVCHAIYLLKGRQKFDKMRAKEMMAEIDAYNKKQTDDKNAEAMHEINHGLKGIMAGRQHFLPTNLKGMSRAVI